MPYRNNEKLYHIVANFRACKTRLFPPNAYAHEPDRQLFSRVWIPQNITQKKIRRCQDE